MKRPSKVGPPPFLLDFRFGNFAFCGHTIATCYSLCNVHSMKKILSYKPLQMHKLSEFLAIIISGVCQQPLITDFQLRGMMLCVLYMCKNSIPRGNEDFCDLVDPLPDNNLDLSIHFLCFRSFLLAPEKSSGKHRWRSIHITD